MPWWVQLLLAFQSFMALAMTALLWSFRRAYRAGQWTTELDGRLKAVEERLRYISTKQSEIASEHQTRVGEVALRLAHMESEFRVAWAASIQDHQRFDRELSDLRRLRGES